MHTPPGGTAAADLLYLLHGDAADLAEVLSTMRAADVAEALNGLPSEAGARVLAALPFDLAVQLLDEPGLGCKLELFQAMPTHVATALLDGMSADQQADLFRELPDRERSRLLKTLPPATQRTLSVLLAYPPESAGGIMTTEVVTVPWTWTVDETLRHIAQVGGAKETVYAGSIRPAPRRPSSPRSWT